MVAEQYFLDRDIAPSTSRYEKRTLRAFERTLKALCFAFRCVVIALDGATRFVFNIYKPCMVI